MTNAASANNENFWNFDYYPEPSRDKEILKELGFIPGLKEILMLRQVHALEHATVWVLSETDKASNNREASANLNQKDNENLGGLSTERGFYLYGQVNPLALKRAVLAALKRIQSGEWDLAVHPRCGTNLSVAMFLTTGLVLGAHLLLPRGPIEQVIGVGIAATTAAQLAPDLGREAQKYLTTSIPFNLEVKNISHTSDIWGRPAYFVGVQWRDSQ
ncbi:MAG: DUF6391 domain-containing protein [Prochloraceae cyanobacterium]|nr:DUF6391 domain-containing protein [Prochloraceae cyanobacterium]